MPERQNIRKGKEAEILAANFLEGMGFHILDMNYRSGAREIDIISRSGDLVVFVEVKYRNSREFGDPEEFVDSAKAEFVREAAEDWIVQYNWEGRIRFDIIAVSGDQSPGEITHFEDGF